MPDERTAGDFIHFAEQPPKRKRAEAVCVHCHSKKIKCDVQKRTEAGQAKCSNCDTGRRDCQIRNSQRGRRKHAESNNGVANPPDAIESSAGVNVEETGRDFASIGPAADEELSPSTSFNRHASDVQHPLPNGDDDSQIAALTNLTPVGVAQSGSAMHTHADDVDAGYLQVYGLENQLDAQLQEIQAIPLPTQDHSDPQSTDSSLTSTFLETYWEYCYCFCPVLDRASVSSEIARSPMLASAIALAASHIQPPLLSYDGPEKYYNKARMLFYEDGEPDNLVALKALSLFYWWAPRPPSTIHRHTSWWWQSVIIRHAQQMGLHREPPIGDPLRERLDMSVRRRIWWTAFARERLTALCQSKPCIIDEADCTISEAQLSDFPSDPVSQKKGLIFVHWVRLCGIIGRMAKSRGNTTSGSNSFYADAHRELAHWIEALPPSLQLHLESNSTVPMDRDVYQLHLPYFTALIILHLRRSTHDLPQALPPAILAASCTARLLRDILARGNARFLMAITCWYCGTAFIALLQGSRIPQFAKDAEEGIAVLTSTVEQLQKMWPSANVIRQGFDRLRKNVPAQDLDSEATGQANLSRRSYVHNGNTGFDHIQRAATASPNEPELDWIDLFPFVTRSTNSIAGFLLANRQCGDVTRGMPSPNNLFFYENVMNEWHDFLDPLLMDYQLEFPDLPHFQI